MVHGHPLSLYLVSTIMYKVVVYSLAERAVELLLFLIYPYYTLWVCGYMPHIQSFKNANIHDFENENMNTTKNYK